MNDDRALAHIHDEFESYSMPARPQTDGPSLDGDVRQAGFERGAPLQHRHVGGF
jgi:hypothetical protein